MFKKLFLIVFIISTTSPAYGLQITFRKNATVNGSTITLGDIVDFDEDSEFSRALATQVIGQAPLPGETVSLRSLNIKNYLLTKLDLPDHTLWQGSPSVSLSRLGIYIGPTRILKIIDEYLKKNKKNLPDAEIHFNPGVLPIPFTLPAGKLTWEVVPSNPRILGSSRFSIIFRVDDRVAKNMSIKGKLEALAPVVIAAARLSKGTILNRSHLTLATKDLGRYSSAGTNITDFIGKRLKRSLREGSVITTSMIEGRPVIKRGQRVKIVLHHGNMFLSAVGIARNNGRQDQMIRVQNISSNKIIYCRVAAPGLVEVTL
ncbi:flagellar basal body P-ring formation chaperone FlgA [Desulfomarina sp.]